MNRRTATTELSRILAQLDALTKDVRALRDGLSAGKGSAENRAYDVTPLSPEEVAEKYNISVEPPDHGEAPSWWAEWDRQRLGERDD